MLPLVLEDDRDTKQYYIHRILPHLMNLISANIQVIILQKLHTDPPIPPPPLQQSKALFRTIWTGASTTIPKKLSERTQ